MFLMVLVHVPYYFFVLSLIYTLVLLTYLVELFEEILLVYHYAYYNLPPENIWFTSARDLRNLPLPTTFKQNS